MQNSVSRIDHISGITLLTMHRVLVKRYLGNSSSRYIDDHVESTAAMPDVRVSLLQLPSGSDEIQTGSECAVCQ